MQVQWTGIVAALATFGGVWAGHVGVRAIEYHARRLVPAQALLAAMGLGLELLSASTPSLLLAVASGILGMTLLFDALELRRQFRRVREGRAPANPANPRHAPYLAAAKAKTAGFDGAPGSGR